VRLCGESSLHLIGCNSERYTPTTFKHVYDYPATFAKITPTETVQPSINQTLCKGNISVQFDALPHAIDEKNA
jgi:hypothetical protein